VYRQGIGLTGGPAAGTESPVLPGAPRV
jgi:hypothetical protein